MILNSNETATEDSVRKLATSLKASGMPPITESKNLSDKFLDALRKNYLAVKKREKDLGAFGEVSSVTNKRYRELFENHESTFGVTQDMRDQSRTIPDTKNSLNRDMNRDYMPSFVFNALKSKMDENRVMKKMPKSVLLRKTANRVQSLHFLANLATEKNYETASYARLLDTNRSPKPRNEGLRIKNEIRIKRRLQLPDSVTKENIARNTVRPSEMYTVFTARNFCDYHGSSFEKTFELFPMNGSTARAKSKNLTPLLKVDGDQMEFRQSGDFRSSRSSARFEYLDLPNSNKVLTKKRTRLNSKDRGLIFDTIIKTSNRAKTPADGQHMLQIAQDRLDRHNQYLTKAKLKESGQGKFNTIRRHTQIFQDPPEDSLNRVMFKTLTNIKPVNNNTVWMKIIDKLIATEKCNTETPVGYYDYFRLLRNIEEEYKDNIVICMILKLRADLANEKKFKFNFRVGND